MAHTYSFPGTKLSLCWLFCRGLLVICWTRMGTGGKEGPFGDLRTTTLHSTYQYVGLYIPYLDPGSKNFPSKVPHKSWILDSGSKYSGILKSIYPTCRYLVSDGEHSWINIFFVGPVSVIVPGFTVNLESIKHAFLFVQKVNLLQ